MARTFQSPRAPISGKIGKLVYCNGVNGSYVRSAPRKSKNPPTEKQLATQERFKMGISFLSPFRQLIADSWMPPRGTTAFNEAFRHILQSGLKGEFPSFFINYSNVLLSKGILLQPIFAAGQLDAEELCISWAVVNQSKSFRDDEVIVAVYNESRDIHMVFKPEVERSAGVVFLPLDNAFAGDKLHGWLIFQSKCGRFFSDSLYVNIQS